MFSILICIFIAILHQTSGENIIDLNALMTEYIKLCGYDYICQPKLFSSLPQPDINYSQVTDYCPYCSCHKHCRSQRNCCPDVYFRTHMQTCSSATIFGQENDEIPSIFFYMFTDCPDAYNNSKIVNACEKEYSAKELLDLPFVTSLDTSLAYRNHYCALCHNEKSVLAWSLHKRCLQDADFNYVSSTQEMFDLANQSKCVIEYGQSDVDIERCVTGNQNAPNATDFCELNSLVALNNTEYVSVALACNSDYERPFNGFKNVFCYICNSETDHSHDIHQVVTIENCEHDSHVQNDKTIATACHLHGFTKATLPYKNIFCYLCNIHTHGAFRDVRATTKTYIYMWQDTMYQTYRIYNMKYRKDLLDSSYANISVSEIGLNPSMITYNNASLDVTDILIHKMAANPVDNICNFKPQFVPEEYMAYATSRQSCSCSPECLFDQTIGSCCYDTVMKYKTTCMHMHRNSNRDSRTIIVADGCWGKPGHPPHTLKERIACERNYSEQIFNIPVIGNSGIIYKNIFCYQCSDFERNDIDQPMQIDITCPFIFNVQHYTLLSVILDLLLDLDCHMQFIVPNGTPYMDGLPYCNPYDDTLTTQMISECSNNTNTQSSGIRWACEDAPGRLFPAYVIDMPSENSNASTVYSRGYYKNIFCFLCSHNSSTQNTVIDECNVTGNMEHYDYSVKQACNFFPALSAFSPYKNWFCMHCNVITIGYIYYEIIEFYAKNKTSCNDVWTCIGNRGYGYNGPRTSIVLTYKHIFSIFDKHDPDLKGSTGNIECHDSNIVLDAFKVGNMYFVNALLRIL